MKIMKVQLMDVHQTSCHGMMKTYDGIEDHIDQCPNIKENYNKFQDEDGCPDNSL